MHERSILAPMSKRCLEKWRRLGALEGGRCPRPVHYCHKMPPTGSASCGEATARNHTNVMLARTTIHREVQNGSKAFV